MVSCVEIYRFIQLEKRPTVVLKAKIEKVYYDPNTGRGYILRGQPCFDCSYSYEGQTYYSKQHFSKKELGLYKEGDYVEVIVSRKNLQYERDRAIELRNKGMLRDEKYHKIP